MLCRVLHQILQWTSKCGPTADKQDNGKTDLKWNYLDTKIKLNSCSLSLISSRLLLSAFLLENFAYDVSTILLDKRKLILQHIEVIAVHLMRKLLNFIYCIPLDLKLYNLIQSYIFVCSYFDDDAFYRLIYGWIIFP